MEPLTVSAPIEVWKKINQLANRIQSPVVGYQFNHVAMAETVIRLQMSLAADIQRLIPDVVHNDGPFDAA
jgi:hypothetical protein